MPVQKLSQKDYWNSRANVKGKYGPPLNLSQAEIEFQKQFLVPGGNTLVLGATTALCTIARQIAGKTVSVDFAEKIITALRQDGVTYICEEWTDFLKKTDMLFDNIVTDGGLLCLEFPKKWAEIAKLIYEHLKPHGIFTDKVYLSTDTPIQHSINPSLNRFMTLPSRAENNWMVTPIHPDYQGYDVHYALPPETEVHKTFNRFKLIDRYEPEYEAGDHFISFAWKKM